MKKTLILSTALVFLMNFTVAAQDAMPQGGEEAMGGNENNQQNQEKPQTAEELFPYKDNLRTPIMRSDYATSLKRTEEIAKRVKKAFLPDAAGREKYVKLPANAQEGTRPEEFDENKIRRDLEEQISKEVLGGKSVNPVGQPLAGTRLKAREAVQNEVKKKFAKSDKEMADIFAKEAEKKYPLAKKGEKVTVHFTIGRSTYRVSGTFYGYGIRNRSIMINSRSVSVRDLSPADIAKFSIADNKRTRQIYVNTSMKKYREKKFQYEKKLADALLEREIAENDKNGFIYYGIFKEKNLPAKFQTQYKEGVLAPEDRLKGCSNEWVSADKVIMDMAQDMISVTKKRIAYERTIEEKRLAELRRKQREEAERKRQEEAQKNNNNPENPNPEGGNANGGNENNPPM